MARRVDTDCLHIDCLPSYDESFNTFEALKANRSIYLFLEPQTLSRKIRQLNTSTIPASSCLRNFV